MKMIATKRLGAPTILTAAALFALTPTSAQAETSSPAPGGPTVVSGDNSSNCQINWVARSIPGGGEGAAVDTHKVSPALTPTSALTSPSAGAMETDVTVTAPDAQMMRTVTVTVLYASKIAQPNALISFMGYEGVTGDYTVHQWAHSAVPEATLRAWAANQSLGDTSGWAYSDGLLAPSTSGWDNSWYLPTDATDAQTLWGQAFSVTVTNDQWMAWSLGAQSRFEVGLFTLLPQGNPGCLTPSWAASTEQVDGVANDVIKPVTEGLVLLSDTGWDPATGKRVQTYGVRSDYTTQLFDSTEVQRVVMTYTDAGVWEKVTTTTTTRVPVTTCAPDKLTDQRVGLYQVDQFTSTFLKGRWHLGKKVLKTVPLDTLDLRARPDAARIDDDNLYYRSEGAYTHGSTNPWSPTGRGKFVEVTPAKLVRYGSVPAVVKAETGLSIVANQKVMLRGQSFAKAFKLGAGASRTAPFGVTGGVAQTDYDALGLLRVKGACTTTYVDKTTTSTETVKPPQPPVQIDVIRRTPQPK